MTLTLGNGTHGRGVFTEEPIAAGTKILSFTGPLLHYTDTTPTTFALQIGPDLYLGASGGMDDFINHSCDPNAGMRIAGTTVNLYAIRDIKAGEEICFDYSTTLDEDDFTMTCLCGAPGCRRIVGDGKYLPPAVWHRYCELGIIPDYVQASRARSRHQNIPQGGKE